MWCFTPGDLQYETNLPSDSCPVLSAKQMISTANQKLPGKTLDLQHGLSIRDILASLQSAVEPETDNSRAVRAVGASVLDEFRPIYKDFLQKVPVMSNLAAVIEMGKKLMEKLPLNPEPSEEQKQSLKAETSEMVAQANSSITEFIGKRQREIEDLLQMIRSANEMLEDPKILRTGEL